MAPEGFGKSSRQKKLLFKERKGRYNRHRARTPAIPRFPKMIYLEIAYAQKDEAKPFGARWDTESKAYFFEKRSGQALPLELEGFEPKQSVGKRRSRAS